MCVCGVPQSAAAQRQTHRQQALNTFKLALIFHQQITTRKLWGKYYCVLLEVQSDRGRHEPTPLLYPNSTTDTHHIRLNVFAEVLELMSVKIITFKSWHLLTMITQRESQKQQSISLLRSSSVSSSWLFVPLLCVPGVHTEGTLLPIRSYRGLHSGDRGQRLLLSTARHLACAGYILWHLWAQRTLTLPGQCVCVCVC